MVFSKIMNNMKNILDDSKKQKNNSQNKKIIDNLINQGKLHKRNKQIKIKTFNEKKHIIENNTNIFSKGDKQIHEMHEKTSKVLQDLHQKYNNDLSEWGTAHRAFTDNYTKFQGLINDCHEHCIKKYPAGEGEDRNNKINSCKNGCSLEQPELMPAKDDDTYVDSNGILQTLDCNIPATKCLDGYIKGLGSGPTNEQIKGCTACGGGSGGPAIIRQSGSNRSKNIKSCDDIDEAYSITTQTSLKSMCSEGRTKMNQLDTTKFDFKTKYADLSTLNNKLDTTAKTFESESNKIEKIKKKIRSQLHKINGYDYEGMQIMEGYETRNMEELLDEYSSIQAEINKLSGHKNNNKTSEAQLEDIELKMKSERMQLYLWSGLAILTMLLVIQKMKQ